MSLLFAIGTRRATVDTIAMIVIIVVIMTSIFNKPTIAVGHSLQYRRRLSLGVGWGEAFSHSGYPIPLGDRVSNVSWCGQVAHCESVLTVRQK